MYDKKKYLSSSECIKKNKIISIAITLTLFAIIKRFVK